MKQFFKFMFASMFGFLIAGFLLVFILLGIIAGLTVKSDDTDSGVKENSVLNIQLSTIIPERTLKDPMGNLSIPGISTDNPVGLNDILKNIEKATDDNNIKGIFINADVSPNDYATLEEIRNALIDFKKSGKFVYAYAEIMDEHSYYVSSVADKVYLNPSGEILLNGFAYQTIYLKGLLDKLGLQPELIRHGKFKSAGEPFIADKMSDENRKQIETYMGSLYEHFLSQIAKSRKLDNSLVTDVVNHMKIQQAKDALQLKFIDGLKYKDEVDAEIRKKLGIGENDKITLVSMKRYKSVPGNTSVSDNKIAVVYCVGDIMGGEGDDESIGSDRFAETIRKIRTDDNYKALVLRINSPGGSALASDVIWREITLCRKKKPVIVSMGAVAASGGYYIAAPANRILAEPNTITGSIGVFGMLLNAKELLNNKLGVKVETVKLGEFSDLGSPDRPLTEAEKAIIQRSIDRVYDDFISRVAEGRKLTKEQVDEIAQGRVWSGADALKIGLVDELGGLDKAIEIAAKEAKLSEYRTVNLPDLKDPFEEFLNSLGSDASAYFVRKELGLNWNDYNEIRKSLQYQGIQMRVPFSVKID